MSNNKVWIDESPLASVVNITGNPYQGSISPNPPVSGVEYNPLVHGGSVYLAPTNKLSIPYSSDLDFGTGNFTFEFWINPKSQSGNTSIMSSGVNGSDNWEIYMATNDVRFGTSSWFMSCGSAPFDTWTHFAISKTGATIRTYKNGIQQSVRSPGVSDTLNTAGGIVIGQYASLSYYLGYIGGIRLVKGVNLYPNGTSFTPPFVMEAVSGSVLVLNHYNIGIFDSACKANVNLYAGARNISTFKYGDGSLQADASGSFGEVVAADGYLKNPLSTSDFTFELWINDPPLDVRVRPLISIGGRFSIGSINFCLEDAKASLYLDGTRVLLSSNTFSTGWVHIAVSRQGNTYRIFINGVLSGTATYSGFNNTNSFFEIAGGGNYNGINTQIDDLRIMITVARYITTFTPPTSGLPKA